MKETYFVHMSLVPVRATPSDKAEMVTQLHFGDVIALLGRDRQWLQVSSFYDEYTGWIDEKSALKVDVGWLQDGLVWEWVLEDSCIAQTVRAGAPLPIRLGLGSRIPRRPDGLVRIGDWELTHAPCFRHVMAPDGYFGLIQLSARFLGVPYLWGGKSLAGIDCSGFTQLVYGISGYRLPRDAYQQALAGEAVSFQHRTEGDLAFFQNAEGKVNHVGIVLPDGNIRHASGQVHDATFTAEGIIGRYSGTLTHPLHSIKRIF